MANWQFIEMRNLASQRPEFHMLGKAGQIDAIADEKGRPKCYGHFRNLRFYNKERKEDKFNLFALIRLWKNKDRDQDQFENVASISSSCAEYNLRMKVNPQWSACRWRSAVSVLDNGASWWKDWHRKDCHFPKRMCQAWFPSKYCAVERCRLCTECMYTRSFSQKIFIFPAWLNTRERIAKENLSSKLRRINPACLQDGKTTLRNTVFLPFWTDDTSISLSETVLWHYCLEIVQINYQTKSSLTPHQELNTKIYPSVTMARR